MMTDEELAKYYDTHSILKDYRIAKKNGDVLYCKAGENPIEAMRKHKAEKKRLAEMTAVPKTRPRAATQRSVAAAAMA